MSDIKTRRLSYWLPRRFPIDDLPEELLAEIFVWWADIDKDAPWMATLVSRQWHSTVLSCPRAWNKIHVCLTHPEEKEDPEWCVEEEDNDPHRQRRPLRLWFARARDADLYVSVEIGRIPSRMDYICNVLGWMEPVRILSFIHPALVLTFYIN